MSSAEPWQFVRVAWMLAWSLGGFTRFTMERIQASSSWFIFSVEMWNIHFKMGTQLKYGLQQSRICIPRGTTWLWVWRKPRRNLPLNVNFGILQEAEQCFWWLSLFRCFSLSSSYSFSADWKFSICKFSISPSHLGISRRFLGLKNFDLCFCLSRTRHSFLTSKACHQNVVSVFISPSSIRVFLPLGILYTIHRHYLFIDHRHQHRSNNTWQCSHTYETVQNSLSLFTNVWHCSQNFKTWTCPLHVFKNWTFFYKWTYIVLLFYLNEIPQIMNITYTYILSGTL